RFEPPVMANTAYVEAFAIYLASFTLLPIPLFKFLKIENWILWSWPMIALLPVAMWWAHYRGNSWRDVRRAFGWHGGSGWWIEAPLGVAGYIAGLPVMLVGFLMTWVLIKMAGASPTHPIVNEVHGSAVHILGIYLLACVWAPVFEESMFRGALFAHLRRRWGWAMSAFPVALIFAAIHPQGWTTIPLLGSVALVLAAIREWRGSIIASIVCHACVNFGSVTLLVLLTR
ncbi:MAG TPA: type II CAAX endopeptidase family protein, partial [Tepidisphaeraceae bacterium]|nr:type II CAAX endopeptidase family protein [Tepidisphaeraceae bacterium]